MSHSDPDNERNTVIATPFGTLFDILSQRPRDRSAPIDGVEQRANPSQAISC